MRGAKKRFVFPEVRQKESLHKKGEIIWRNMHEKAKKVSLGHAKTLCFPDTVVAF